VYVDSLCGGEMPFGAGGCGDEGELADPLVGTGGENSAAALQILAGHYRWSRGRTGPIAKHIPSALCERNVCF